MEQRASMRILFTTLALAGCFFAKGQSHALAPAYPTAPVYPRGSAYTIANPLIFSPYGFTGMPFDFIAPGNLSQKWQLKTFAGISAGYSFFSGSGYNGGASYLTVPVGAVLLHPLNKNLTAFGAVSATPTLFSANQFIAPASYSSYPGGIFSRPYTPSLNARVEGGLIYTNDDKTFSISGSIGVERSSYPVYSPNRPATKNP